MVDALLPGDPDHVGRYQLLGRLGQGGMGQVFLAQSPGGRQVAVKLIRADVADDPEFLARFAREVAAARNVSGMFTAPVVDADLGSQPPWLVTAYVPGPSLAAEVAARGPLPAGSTVTLAAGLAEGLAAIHAAGVVHRDLKPANVLLAPDGPRIIDFGISRTMGASALTRTDFVVGSPGFMSPEQAQGRGAGPASDIFCLGAVLVFASTGQSPFGTGSAQELLYRIVHDPPATGQVPASIRSLVLRCLDKDPRRRPTADQVLAELAGRHLAVRPAQQQPPVGGFRTYSQEGPGPTHSQEGAGPTHSQEGAGPTHSQEGAGPTNWPAGDGRTAGGTTSELPAVPGLTSRPRAVARRRSRWVWAIPAAALIALGGAAAAIIVPRPGASTPAPVQSSSSSSSAAPAPVTVVREYFAAINHHNWRAVWRLGGKNFASSYRQMVRGYRNTSRDDLLSVSAHGNTVDVTFAAHETTGTVREYTGQYTVTDGVITSAQVAARAPA